MSSSKLKPEPKRVVCQCQSSGCYKGVYLDASGVLQPGVEVLRSTKESHERADRRNLINHITTSALPSRHPANSSQTPNTDSQEVLIAPLEGLLLGSQHKTLARSRANSINTGQRLIQVHSTTAGQDQTTDQDKSHVVDAEICAATATAREKGVQEYDCGELVSWISGKTPDFLTVHWSFYRPLPFINPGQSQPCLPSRSAHSRSEVHF
ncbi:uncharacterized protein MELLADRAFT_58978 [Melampsora larici-populina 98AG31]|uniref:Uncharacterized protein n=1 Tax=Melampsora larici-populina (strain 98AG31 / pathotype 3-4-7) TaxID=747676 RepID=F4R6M2_MELLP|nr:uncharacterized protein MELLADRAFT_58978 [Melampsora larici-populina 98AG31]EGG12437.1 hypothetical protein MELLADRAFT_58978 [Melampsora larici-populina 98AG31]